MLLGPLFHLRWLGTLCPCLEKEGDQSARLALTELSSLAVRWDRSSGQEAGVKQKLGGLVSGLFGKSNPMNAVSTASPTGSNTPGKVEAKLQWVDSEQGPQLNIVPYESVSDPESGEIAMKQSGGYIKTIPLRKIERVVLEESGGIMGGERCICLKSKKLKKGTPSTLASFEVKGARLDSLMEIREQFMRLVEWDGRCRQAMTLDELEAQETDDEDMSDGGLAARTKKAAHFAKREIEMKQSKREREQRKARYIKDGAGLKYTAIAMANR